MPKGKFVVIEGMDGVGTTTQARLLVDYLKSEGLKVAYSAQPSNSNIGQEARRLLAAPIEKNSHMLASLALCFAADRMQHTNNFIEPSLKEYDFVILDRYILSSLVYQGLDFPTSWVKEINRFAPVPDLCLVFDLDAKTSHERINARKVQNDFYESVEILEKIRGRYLHFANAEPSHHVLIDASGSKEKVFSHVKNIMNEKFFRKKNG